MGPALVQTVWLGIDPGLKGAAVLMNPSGRVAIGTRTPLIGPSSKGRDQHDVRAMSAFLDSVEVYCREGHYTPRAALERVHSMPGQGVASMFSFGHGFGLWHGLLFARGWSVHMIAPKDWQRAMLRGRSRADIKASCAQVAMELWPELKIRTKADWGLADAALIAEAARRALDARPARGKWFDVDGPAPAAD